MTQKDKTPHNENRPLSKRMSSSPKVRVDDPKAMSATKQAIVRAKNPKATITVSLTSENFRSNQERKSNGRQARIFPWRKGSINRLRRKLHLPQIYGSLHRCRNRFGRESLTLPVESASRRPKGRL